MTPEFVRLTNRAAAVVKSVGIINAVLDAQALRWVGESNQAVADLI
jgi:hypothetical protein